MVILQYPKRLKADIALLQETHLAAEDFNHTRKLWVGQVFSSAAVKGKAGVLSPIHKNLSCEVLLIERDAEGHVLTAKLRLSTREWVLSNTYVPNSPSKHFFQTLSFHFAPFLHLPLLVGGDFNSVMHLLEDKSPGRGSPGAPLLHSLPPWHILWMCGWLFLLQSHFIQIHHQFSHPWELFLSMPLS